jgi:hypothetical protein
MYPILSARLAGHLPVRSLNEGGAFACPPLAGTLEWEKIFPDPVVVIEQTRNLLAFT